uniref:Putative secreted protein n=1 Tax=Ixodes ricinus TaxID=34613 RepID=V5HCM2_IXORI
MSLPQLLLLVVLVTCGFLCVANASMEAKRMGSEFLGKRSRMDAADLISGLWEEDGQPRPSAARVRFLRTAAALNRLGALEDDDDALEASPLMSDLSAAALYAKQKRIGSEFLGKRSSADLVQKRMGSEFLGRRKRDAVHGDFPPPVVGPLDA